MNERDAVLATMREYALGPFRFMNLQSLFELGVVDRLRDHGPLTADALAEGLDVRATALEQILLLPLKEGLIAQDAATGEYSLAGLASLEPADLARVVPWLAMVKDVCLRQLYWLTESVREARTVGLKELYGFDGTFYEASTVHPELFAAWGEMMDEVTGFIDPWFLENLEVPDGAKVLDVAGNTGMGAVLVTRAKAENKPLVTSFDFPEKEEETLRTYAEHGVSASCSFAGGDVFEGLPGGYDLVMIKHFLDMFDQERVHTILTHAFEALEPGGQCAVLVPVYPEDLRSDHMVDFFPAYFYGATMAQGGPQKISTYQRWMESVGFTVTRTLAQDPATMPPDVIPVHGLLCGTKTP